MKSLGYILIIIGFILCGIGLLYIVFGMPMAIFGDYNNSLRLILILLIAMAVAGIFIFSLGYGLVYEENPLISELNYLGLEKAPRKFITLEDLKMDLGTGIHVAFKAIPFMLGGFFMIVFMQYLSFIDLALALWFIALGVILVKIRRVGYFSKYEALWTFAFCYGDRVIIKRSFLEPQIYKIYVDYKDYANRRNKRRIGLSGYKEERKYELELHTSKGYLVLYEDFERKEIEHRVKALHTYYSN